MQNWQQEGTLGEGIGTPSPGCSSQVLPNDPDMVCSLY